jgi:hypothetical protein
VYDMYNYDGAARNADESARGSKTAPDGQAGSLPTRAAHLPDVRVATAGADRGPAAQAVQVALDRRDNGGAWSTLPEA